MTRPLIEARGLGFRRGGHAILTGIDLTVGRGEIVSVIGPNGAGKTSLLRLLLGLERGDAGSVVRAPGLRIGYMPQRLAIDPSLPLTARRFLSLGGPVAPGRRRQVMAEVGIADAADRPMQGLSGGETQRVLLARALLRDPDLLVLDEPAQGVDVQGQIDLYATIAALRDRRGCGVLLVSHDLHLVMAATDRVICLNRHVCCTGHPEAVSRDPAYLALFGAAAARHLALYAHHHDHAHDLDGAVAGDGSQPPAARHHHHG
ncbi:MAG: zinc ABC transporter ATP-binding protein ZnuC [Thalassobaculales bacterium]